MKRSGRGLILMYCPVISLEGLLKTKKNLIHDSRSPERGINPGVPDYEAGVLTTRPRHSITANNERKQTK
jgi:hypothetical protein